MARRECFLELVATEVAQTVRLHNSEANEMDSRHTGEVIAAADLHKARSLVLAMHASSNAYVAWDTAGAVLKTQKKQAFL